MTILDFQYVDREFEFSQAHLTAIGSTSARGWQLFSYSWGNLAGRARPSKPIKVNSESRSRSSKPASDNPCKWFSFLTEDGHYLDTEILMYAGEQRTQADPMEKNPYFIASCKLTEKHTGSSDIFSTRHLPSFIFPEI